MLTDKEFNEIWLRIFGIKSRFHDIPFRPRIIGIDWIKNTRNIKAGIIREVR